MGVNLVALMHFWFSPAAAGRRNFCGCNGAQLRICIRLFIVDQLADMDQICGISMASGGTYLCGVQNAVLYLAAKIN
jgi:hypothetical protein